MKQKLTSFCKMKAKTTVTFISIIFIVLILVISSSSSSASSAASASTSIKNNIVGQLKIRQRQNRRREYEDFSTEDENDSSDGNTNPSSGNGGAVDCSQYQQTASINNKLELSWVVNESSQLSSQPTLSAQLLYKGRGWIGFGPALNSNGPMIGSEAIIGLPDDPISPQTNPAKYTMSNKVPSAVQLMPPSQQTLLNSNIEITPEGYTRMTFTKLLAEPNELQMSINQRETFVYAVGDLSLSSNPTITFHNVAYGSFGVVLQVCDPITGVSGSGLDLNSKPKSYQTYWKAHGILAMIAWAFFAPLAVSASLLRNLGGRAKSSPLWFKIHMYSNIMTFVLTVAAIALAITATNKSSLNGTGLDIHFNRKHQRMGLAIFIVVFVQIMGGLLRPHVTSAASSLGKNDRMMTDHTMTGMTDHSTSKNTSDEETQQDFNARGTTNGTTMDDYDHTDNGFTSSTTTNNSNNNNKGQTKSMTRRVWEIGHRVLGLSLLACTVWQIQNGLGLYSTFYGTKDYTTAYWIWFGVTSGVVVLLKCFVLLVQK